MEKQRSFSAKPIKYLVPSFTISFSVICLIFFPAWVFKPTPSLTQNLGVSSTLKDFDGSSSDFVLKNSIFMERNVQRDGNSSKIVADVSRFEGGERRESEVADAESKDGILNGNFSLTPFGKNLSLDGVNFTYSKKSIADESERLSHVKSSGDSADSNDSDEEIQEAESKGSLFTGNSSLTPFGKNLSLDGVNVTYSKKSTVDESEELSHVKSSGDSVDNDNSDEDIRELDDVVDKGDVVVENLAIEKEDRTSLVSFEKQHNSIRDSVEEKNKVDCDVTKGRWVFDESYPLYTNVTCPFIDEGFNCEGNGRLDKDYMKWRWQPQDCDIPRFNATKMLELIRGKRLVFVGDSLNRNQWESMLCLLVGAVKDPKKVYEARGRKITKQRNNYCFKFEDYKCTVEFYVSHFLVHESTARIGKKRKQTLRIDTIGKGSSRWRGADILVVNTAHWWNHHKTKAGINYYQEGDQVHPYLDVTKAFRRALLTWASWVDKNINPRKTHIFFRSSAPSHFSGGLWNMGGHCKEAFRPINETFTSIYPERNMIVEEVLKQMKTPVTYLNITRLSDYRPDAHPSMYGRKSVNAGVQDCSHWCLPGVPDNWNELLYYYLQSRTKASFVD